MAWNFFDLLVFAAGYAACWYTKDYVTKTYMGSQNFVASLEAKVAALKTKL
jgi:hypothetical protein